MATTRRRPRAGGDDTPAVNPRPTGEPASAELVSGSPPKDPAGAWAIEPQPGDVWTPRPWVEPALRREAGRAERGRVPRSSHAAFEPPVGRNPLALIEAQEADRLTDLIPLRHARMAASPFAYYRGTPVVMAYDLSSTRRTNLLVQASGDAHIANFGLYASPERQIVFDANDFDETLPAPWEWDVKRLAASVVIAGRQNGFDRRANRRAAMAAVGAYRQQMARFAGMRLIDVWYSGITESNLRAVVEKAVRGRRDASVRLAKLETLFSAARGRDVLRATAKLTRVVDGRLVINDDPPMVQHVDIPGGEEELRRIFEDYRATMPHGQRQFLERYRFADFALKVVGVGSIGSRCFVLVLQGRDEGDPLILQAKEAGQSVLEPYVERGAHGHHGERVVHGQRVMQATSDIFLGWTRSIAGRDFYLRQLWDMKGSVDITRLDELGLGFYGGVCAWSLAAAHARSGDAVAISAYLGSADTFDGAVADFAEAYADQNERDHAAFVTAAQAESKGLSLPSSSKRSIG